MEFLTVYKKVNNIEDPSIRTLCMQILDEHWDDYYTKRFTVRGKRNGLMAGQLAGDALSNLEVMKRVFKGFDIDWDVVQFLLMVYPIYRGLGYSHEEVDGWDYMKTIEMWRDPEYESYIYEWRDSLNKLIKDYPMKKEKGKLIRDILYDVDRSSLEFTVWYQLDRMMKSNLTIK